MSDIRNCPICGTKSKYKEKDGKPIYKGLTDEEKGKKIQQLKKAMISFKQKAEALEKELQDIRKTRP